MPTPASASADLLLLDTFWNEPVERIVLPNGEDEWMDDGGRGRAVG